MYTSHSPSREEQGSSHEHADRSDEESLLGGEESDLDDEYDSEESIESITESDRFFPADMSQPNPDIFPRHAPRFSSTSTCDAVTFADRTVSNPSRPSSSLRSHSKWVSALGKPSLALVLFRAPSAFVLLCPALIPGSSLREADDTRGRYIAGSTTSTQLGEVASRGLGRVVRAQFSGNPLLSTASQCPHLPSTSRIDMGPCTRRYHHLPHTSRFPHSSFPRNIQPLR